MYKNLRLVYITTPDRDQARKIGRALVEEDLAACVNIIEGMETIYKWDGKIHEHPECLLLVKTHYSRLKKLTRFVTDMHSYEVPCLISFTITEDEGNEEYLEWLERSSKQPFEL